MFGSAFGVGLGGCLGIIAAFIVVFFLIAFCTAALGGGGGGGVRTRVLPEHMIRRNLPIHPTS